MFSENRGTVEYFPPEMYFGSKPYTMKCDIWCLAMTFYEIFTGKIPDLSNFLFYN